MAEGSAQNITLEQGPPPTLNLPWDESQMLHDVYQRGVYRPIGDSFGRSREEFLRRCRVAGIAPGQAAFGVQLDLSEIPPTFIADSLRTYELQHAGLVLNARPSYDYNSLDYVHAAMERRKVEQALLRFHELGLIPSPDLPEAPPPAHPRPLPPHRT